MVTLTIAGDIYPQEVSVPYLIRGGAAELFESLLPIFQSSDILIGNLEAPVAGAGSPIEKIGPVHRTPGECLSGLRTAGFQVLNLGNNHSFDYGAEGLAFTISECAKHGFEYVGAGLDLEQASRPLKLNAKGLRLGVVSFSEHEFSIATPNGGGSNPVDIVNFVRTAKSLETEVDFLLVLLHVGSEYYPFPRPSVVEMCRFMVEQGADAVICQQPHCAGCFEEYLGCPIVYGQGYLLFDELRSRKDTQEGYLVSLDVTGRRQSRLRVIPFRHDPNRPGPTLLSEAEERAFLTEMKERNACLKDLHLLHDKWQQFCAANERRYLALIQGYGKGMRRLDQKLGFLRFFSRTERLRMLLHLIRCESHRDVLLRVLSNATASS